MKNPASQRKSAKRRHKGSREGRFPRPILVKSLNLQLNTQKHANLSCCCQKKKNRANIINDRFQQQYFLAGINCKRTEIIGISSRWGPFYA